MSAVKLLIGVYLFSMNEPEAVNLRQHLQKEGDIANGRFSYLDIDDCEWDDDGLYKPFCDMLVEQYGLKIGEQVMLIYSW